MLKNIFYINLSLFYSFEVLARAGGGGKGSGTGSVVSIGVFGLLMAIYKIRRIRMMNQAKRKFSEATTKDPSWNIEDFKENGERIFRNYQKAWMEKDLRPLLEDFDIRYLSKANDILNTKLKDKINILKDIEIKSIELMSVLDVQGKDGDMFVLEFNFKLVDYTINEKTKDFIDSELVQGRFERDIWFESRSKKEKSQAVEYWVFIREGEKWNLFNIHQLSSFFGGLGKVTVSQLRKILEKEKALGEHDPIDDSFLYKE